ncbi:ThuA domain-containing protein [Solirubrobacter deserti]|uniref:ThuA domain-containing protein n=1 Tax=Solirubrobacter deserti TaxID=2282478 RepID=A0ABT4RHJ1_9ACTN|nr:ThuA domain-containing protein [Solirubrobacter deserti]MDA0138019.1 ThuA domain-containing protein [Solirubrobacter deserti]
MRAAVAAMSASMLVASGWSGVAHATGTSEEQAAAALAPPTVTAGRTPAGNVRVGVPIAFTATGADADGDTLTYAWDFGDGNTSTAQNPTHTFLAAATRTVKVTVSDGTSTATAELPVVVQANRNPSISVATATPSAGIAPLTTSFTATANDQDGHTVSYAWDLDGDGTFETAGREGSFTFAQPGTHAPTLRVTDPFGGVTNRVVPVTVLAPEVDPSKKFNVLVYSRTAGFRHSSIDEGIAAIKKLGTENDFNVDAIEEPTLFTDAFLARYDAVVFLSTTGDTLPAVAQQEAFERFIRAGNGYVGIHAAADTEYAWPWYGQLVGAYFRNHPTGTPTATVVNEDADHVTNAGIPARWTRVDEWYNYQSPINPVVNGGGIDYSARTSGVHVLLTMDETTYNEADGNTLDDDHPISWCRRFDGGRSWYTGMGHTEASYLDPVFLGHVLGGLKVAAGVVPDDACGIVQVQDEETVGGSVPATLSLAIEGPPAAFEPFVPGVEQDYTATSQLSVVSTAGDASLTVSDPGHMTNGAFTLAEPLRVALSKTAWSAPVSNEKVGVTFNQLIKRTDPLRTGTYSRTLTFTLATSNP